MIKLFKLECPCCGAALSLKMDKSTSTMCTCEYCGSEYIISGVDLKECTAAITKTAGSTNDGAEIKGETVRIETDSIAYIKRGAFRSFVGVVALILCIILQRSLPSILDALRASDSANAEAIGEIFSFLLNICLTGMFVAIMLYMLISILYIIAGVLPKENRAVMIERGLIAALAGGTHDDTDIDQ